MHEILSLQLVQIPPAGSRSARIGGKRTAKGNNLPIADFIIGSCALELGYAIAIDNQRDFSRIPGLNLSSP